MEKTTTRQSIHPISNNTTPPQNTKDNNTKQTLTLLTWNIAGMSSALIQLEEMIENNKPDIIVITETNCATKHIRYHTKGDTIHTSKETEVSAWQQTNYIIAQKPSCGHEPTQ